MATDDGLHHDDLDFLPEPPPVVALGLQILPECLKTPLVSLELPGLYVVLEGVALLVDRVVGQVDKLVSEISLVSVERLCGEPDQAILIEVEPGKKLDFILLS